jgi:hypothetical protein
VKLDLDLFAYPQVDGVQFLFPLLLRIDAHFEPVTAYHCLVAWYFVVNANHNRKQRCMCATAIDEAYIR